MNSKFFKSLALTATMLAASGISAMADDTYTVKMADGTADAEQWTISPNPATAGQTVTLKYNGTKKVKSITAKIIEGNGGSTVVEAPEGAIPGLFSVSADKQVYFAKGNLQATTTDLGANWTWAFAEHQYDIIGNAAANTAVIGNGMVYENGTVDLFGWVGASSTWTGAAQYGISNDISYSTSTSNYGNVADEPLKSDWGNCIGEGWYTLSTAEWLYLLNYGSYANETRANKYGIGTVHSTLGLIILPDGYEAPSGISTAFVPGATNTTYSDADWSAMEAAGAVFLPAAGRRASSSVSDVGSYGYYWSSSADGAREAYDVNFDSSFFPSADGFNRYRGSSVRLVRDVESGSTAGGSTGGGSTGEKILDLATVTEDVVIEDGYTVIGTLDVENYPVCVSIADGATIILDNISIMGRNDDYDYEYAGLECEGDATIILKDGTTNNLRGYCDAGGIYIQPGKTLTIKGETEGTGVLNAKGNGGYGAGIGSGGTSCGNIVIEGGVINAEGGEGSPGIGAGTLGDCGNITITGGTITAIGHGEAAGIGGGGCWLPYVSSRCGNITITDGVTKVTATKGEDAPCAIGPCKDGGCGTVTIGGTVYYDGTDYVNGGDSYLTQETLVYPVYLP